MPTLARLTVIWDTPSDPEAFDRHYREVHVPLALKMPGLRRYTLSKNVVGVRGGDPPFRVGELDWDDIESLRIAFESPAGRATADDVAELTKLANVRSMIYELEDQF